MTLTIKDGVNARCYKQTNLPQKEIMHVFIYIPTCTRIMNFAKAATHNNKHKY